MLLSVTSILLELTLGQFTLAATCVDKLLDCSLYGAGSCRGSYRLWAQENCPATCKFCEAPEPPCEDEDKDCELFDKSTCDNLNYAHWAETNCRYHCRRCSAKQLAAKDAMTTTIPPALCVDKVDCRPYDSPCNATFHEFAKINCMQFCGLCKGPPTPPKACADIIPNCAAYGKRVCNDSHYEVWTLDHCRAYCGLCKNGPAPPIPVTNDDDAIASGYGISPNTVPQAPDDIRIPPLKGK